MKILSAVTTCPRENENYLFGAVASLCEAGFDPLICNDPGLTGSWPALRNALQSLVAQDPDADAYTVFQDDIRVARGLRAWLDTSLWPDDPAKILVCSLYLSGATQITKSGWNDLSQIPVWRPFGACALVFTNSGAKRLISEPMGGLLTGSDTQVGSLARKSRLGYWTHSPSLVQHIGERSAIHVKEVGLTEARVAANFCEDVLLL